MKKQTNISLIIATYNWPEALELCLMSISKQSVLPLEIIIADDGSDERTTRVVRAFSEKATFPVYHEWHEDKGFRKTIILNKAIQRASSAYIVQIDGDIITSPHFLEDHIRAAETGCFIRGTRTSLNKQETELLLTNKKLSWMNRIKLVLQQPANALRLPPCLSKFTTRKELAGRKVKGCNMSFWKQDLMDINGYDNQLQGWGHEDEELSWRLVNLGRKKKIIKFSAVTYHLYHRLLSRQDEPHHRAVMEQIIKEKRIRTDNGIE